MAGRWSLAVSREVDPTRRAHARAESFLERHGVLTRGALDTERTVGGFAGIYRVLRAMEDSGRCRRGYVIEGLGAAQFAVPGAIDRLRAASRAAASGPGRGRRPTRGCAARRRPPRWFSPRPTPRSPGARRWPGRPRSGEAAAPARAQGRRARGPGRRRPGALRRARRAVAAVLHRRPGSWPPPRPSARAVREGWLGTLAVQRADGVGSLGSPGRGAHRGRLPGHPEGPAAAGVARARRRPAGPLRQRDPDRAVHRLTARSATGNVTVKQASPSGAGAAATVAPMRTTSPCTSARPTPPDPTGLRPR